MTTGKHSEVDELRILSPALAEALRAIGARLAAGNALDTEIRSTVSMLGEIDPRDLMLAESEIVLTAGLHYWRWEPSTLKRWFGHRVADADQLAIVDGLEHLFIFHRTGQLREAALAKIRGPLPSAFAFAAIAWRLNDWADPVRRAAAACAERCFPVTPAAIVANAMAALLVRQARWGRWGTERKLLDDAYRRPDVAAALADLFCDRTVGPMASLLRQTMRGAALDPYLPRLAAGAVQPAVRAVATQTLIEGQASWPDGWRWRWIDKSMGVRRRETAFQTRALDHVSNPVGHIERGLADRSAAVRIAALTGLIRRRRELGDVERLASPLIGDPSPAIRERAAFLLRVDS